MSIRINCRNHKIFFRLLATAFVVLFVAVVNLHTTNRVAKAAPVTPPDSCFQFNSATGAITNYYNHENNNSSQPACPKDVDIPESIGGVAVTAIAGPNSLTGAFQNRGLTSLAIPGSVTVVGNNAFRGNQLTSVTISDSVITIDDGAFSSNQLTALAIPGSVTAIGNSAFRGNQLTNLTIPNSVTSIGFSAFSDNHITNLTILNPSTSIGGWAFSGNQLSTLPSYFSDPNVTTIPGGIFSGNKFTELTIPSNITTIGGSAFSSNQLTTLTIPNSVTTIDNNAFRENQLTNLIIPDSVISMGGDAFYSNQLTSVTIGSGLTGISHGVFIYNKLTEVDIPSNVTSVDPIAFALQNPVGGEMDYDDQSPYYLWSSDPSIVQSAYDSIWYARLYTEDPSNPHNLQPGFMREDSWWGSDANNNGHTNDSLGGHLINPARVTLNYRSSTNNQLHQSMTYVGKNDDGSYITSYLAKDNIFPIPLDPSNPTPEEQAALDQGLARYFSPSQTVTIEPLSIPGYITPDPITLTLGTNGSNVDFVYAIYATSQNAGDGGDANPEGGGLAETGVDAGFIIILSAVVLVIAAFLLAANKPGVYRLQRDDQRR